MAYGDDGNETLDPGSRPESQRVASCANRLVVTPGAYRRNNKRRGAWIPAQRHMGMTEREADEVMERQKLQFTDG